MILLELRDYLSEHKRGTLVDMAHRFDLDQHAVSGMLEHWVRKGKVRKLAMSPLCGECSGCDPGLREIYEWV